MRKIKWHINGFNTKDNKKKKDRQPLRLELHFFKVLLLAAAGDRHYYGFPWEGGVKSLS